MMRTGFLIGVVTMLLLNSRCTTSDKEKSGSGTTGTLDSITITFLKRTYRTSQIALHHSSVAMEKAASPEFAALAENIREGQQQLADDIAELSRSRNVNLPDTSRYSSAGRVDSLRQLPAGPELETFLLRAMTGIVRREISTLEKNKDNTSPEVRHLVSNHLPSLKTQLDSLVVLRRKGVPRKR